MTSFRFGLVLLSLALASAGCSLDRSGNSEPAGPARMILAAGVTVLAPESVDTVSSTLDFRQVGLAGVSETYDLTTPAGQPFAFHVTGSAARGSGTVRIALKHAPRVGEIQIDPTPYLADRGVRPSGARLEAWNGTLDSVGDGFARLTLQGSITTDLTLAVTCTTPDGASTALIRLRTGPASPITVISSVDGDYPGILQTRTLYSSDSWAFGMPAAAISGDRATVVCYDGDQSGGYSPERFEMRIQYDGAADSVTGGGSAETSPDSGNWRDHEIAALYNVLAAVHSGDGEIAIRLSFDRGASFAQTHAIPVPESYSRLVQIAMAADYSLAAVWWNMADLMMVEGRPDAFDGTGSPASFAFDPPRTTHHEDRFVSPLTTGVAWSEGGDLVIGYGFTASEVLPDRHWRTTTQNRCAVRLYGENTFTDTVVEEDEVTGYDPSVSTIGSGASLRVFYGCESRQGLHLYASADAGRTFGAPVTIGDPTAHMPSVCARVQNGWIRLDVLYLEYGSMGNELKLTHWDDFDSGTATVHTLQKAEQTGVDAQGWPIYSSVAWFGYDAALDGDDVVVTYVEQKQETTYWMDVLPLGPVAMGAGSDSSPSFTPAVPPPLAPGLTEPLPPPDPSLRNQLKFLRLD